MGKRKSECFTEKSNEVSPLKVLGSGIKITSIDVIGSGPLG